MGRHLIGRFLFLLAVTTIIYFVNGLIALYFRFSLRNVEKVLDHVINAGPKKIFERAFSAMSVTAWGALVPMYKQPRALNERIVYRDIRTLTRVVWYGNKVDHIIAPCKMLSNSRIK